MAGTNHLTYDVATEVVLYSAKINLKPLPNNTMDYGVATLLVLFLCMPCSIANHNSQLQKLQTDHYCTATSCHAF